MNKYYKIIKEKNKELSGLSINYLYIEDYITLEITEKEYVELKQILRAKVQK